MYEERYPPILFNLLTPQGNNVSKTQAHKIIQSPIITW